MAGYHKLRDALLSPAREYAEVRAEERREYTSETWQNRYLFRLYGVPNGEFSNLGLHLSGRMLVETKMDHYAEKIADAVKGIIGDLDALEAERGVPARAAGLTTIDAFAGSANLLFHMACISFDRTFAVRAIGFEFDDKIFGLAEANLSRVSEVRAAAGQPVPPLRLFAEDSMEAPLGADRVGEDDFVVIPVDPPWKDTKWAEGTAMSLDDTTPPVCDIIESYKKRLPRHCARRRLLFAIVCPASTEEASMARLFTSGLLEPLAYLEKIDKGFEWSMRMSIGLATPSASDEV
eukprot:Rhum_TRINITY_DN11907_c0_g2::Rhum_TRINITY_DN11907_c0_g2_i1::g.47816::m.47816